MTRRHRLLLDSAVSLSPANGTRTSVTYGGDASFDSNMVIILAALLCALLCALGLNSVVRFALRCTGTYETARAVTTVRSASSGLVKEAMGRIPVVVYGAGIDVPDTDCPICLGEFAEGDGVRVLPRCGHGFHARCIDRWLVLQSSCPTCRQPVIEHCRHGDKEHARV